jgi:hypothetical protein
VGAQSPVLPVNEPKKTGTCRAGRVARSKPTGLLIKGVFLDCPLNFTVKLAFKNFIIETFRTRGDILLHSESPVDCTFCYKMFSRS